ncbi:MAG: RNB domain-containing ribonuclease, partial [Clostridia bacterium]|nr:RNB domain-containing ribonuclease [Clostridia bacterium]
MKNQIIQGKIQGNERGYGFLIPDNGMEDYFIPHGDLRDAQHGDTVICQTTSSSGVRTTARVLKIVERGIKELVGTYKSMRTGGLVAPDERKYYSNIFIPQGKGFKAKTGDKVVVKILSYPKRLSPEGIIVKVLGKQNQKNAELKSLMFNYRLPESFPDAVISHAKTLPEVTKNQLEGRKDFRSDICFTIDGESSRDFDDAVSIKKDGSNYVLGVHIADVTHYVRQGDVIDKEAFLRATSVYFPESVIPMLPERLSNDLCSLKEGVERLTLSCVMTVDKRGNVVDYLITPSVIKSKRRLTYTKVQQILDCDKSLINEYSDVYDSLLLMDELREILHQKRIERGSVDLDVKESVITVDDNGKIDVSASQSNKAHQLIEEFMILANV